MQADGGTWVTIMFARQPYSTRPQHAGPSCQVLPPGDEKYFPKTGKPHALGNVLYIPSANKNIITHTGAQLDSDPNAPATSDSCPRGTCRCMHPQHRLMHMKPLPSCARRCMAVSLESLKDLAGSCSSGGFWSACQAGPTVPVKCAAAAITGASQ